jgi:hypothetical protein
MLDGRDGLGYESDRVLVRSGSADLGAAGGDEEPCGQRPRRDSDEDEDGDGDEHLCGDRHGAMVGTGRVAE